MILLCLSRVSKGKKMEHELKIIMSGKLNSMVKVYIDDRQVGLIQDVKFHASAHEDFPEVEIVFPNLFDSQVDQNSIRKGGILDMLKKNLDLLKEIPHVKVTLADLDWSKP